MRTQIGYYFITAVCWGRGEVSFKMWDKTVLKRSQTPGCTNKTNLPHGFWDQQRQTPKAWVTAQQWGNRDPLEACAVPVTVPNELFTHWTHSSKGPLSNAMVPFGRREANRADTKSRKCEHPCSRESAPSRKWKAMDAGKTASLLTIPWYTAQDCCPLAKYQHSNEKHASLHSGSCTIHTHTHTHRRTWIHTHASHMYPHAQIHTSGSRKDSKMSPLWITVNQPLWSIYYDEQGPM